MSDLRPKAYQGTTASDAPKKSALSMKSLKLSSEVVLKDGSLALTFMAISSWRVVFLKSCGTATRASTFECVERPSDVIAGTSPDSNVVDPPSLSADAGGLVCVASGPVWVSSKHPNRATHYPLYTSLRELKRDPKV